MNLTIEESLREVTVAFRRFGITANQAGEAIVKAFSIYRMIYTAGLSSDVQRVIRTARFHMMYPSKLLFFEDNESGGLA